VEAEAQDQPRPTSEGEARPTTPPQAFIPDPSGLDFEDALRQIHEQLASVGGGFFQPFQPAGGRRSDDDDDRREFSGMYS